MNAEAEGGKLSSQIKTDEYTAFTCLLKILHDQFGIYCGVPQALECFRVARKVLDDR